MDAFPVIGCALLLASCAETLLPVVVASPPATPAADESTEPSARETPLEAPAPMQAPPALIVGATPPKEPSRPRSAPLASGFYNPMPGGVMAGYQADTGLDIAGSPTPVYAIAAGTLDYSELGHTLWTGPSDTANCVRFELDTPIPYKNHRITHVYYAHLSRLETLQHEGDTPRRHVEAGELLGASGIARHTPHLHIGLLLDGEVEQYWGTFLRADQIRRLLGPFKNGDRLPREPRDASRGSASLRR